MPRLSCELTDCVFNDYSKAECKKDTVYPSDFLVGKHDYYKCFKDYSDRAEYQEEYWRRVQRNGTIYKEKARGKKIEVNGLELFTCERVPPRKKWKERDVVPVHCTEKISGLGILLQYAVAYPQNIKKAAADMRPVESLPEWKREARK